MPSMNKVLKHIDIESVPRNHKSQMHIAIIIKNGKVLAKATNRIGSRSKGSGYSGMTIHAERAVIKKLGDESQLRGASMIVVRVAKGTGDIAYSKPCEECQVHLEKCMREHGLKHVYYS